MPIVYFDASRGRPGPESDAAAQTLGLPATGPDQEVMQQLAGVFAVKAPGTTTNGAAFRWANGDKFQLLHAGIDEAFGVFPSFNTGGALDPNNTYPEGPWTLELSDNLANFADVHTTRTVDEAFALLPSGELGAQPTPNTTFDFDVADAHAEEQVEEHVSAS